MRGIRASVQRAIGTTTWSEANGQALSQGLLPLKSD